MATKRVRNHANPLNFYQKMGPYNLDEMFTPFNQRIDLEIGSGRGLFLRHYAKLHPERHIVGVEVRPQMVELLKNNITKEDISNAAILYGTGQRCLEDIVEKPMIDRCFIFHPDPWFKDRHHKRRIVQPALLKELAKKMTPNGRVYLSTDVEVLWEDMVEQMGTSTFFTAVKNDSFWETEYQTHWAKFSAEDRRNAFHGTWELNQS
ncbi:tRNA (guanosine(46)-N7)-methyltransferase TrmB [bacterium]|jgi:tRNA (guanine-N7-)-methyltransferase|nr:tRNA (guanosine(46)-N7)-methyltransferase TrmB [bacterium]